MIPQIASLLAPLASEAGKQTIKWGGIAVAVLAIIGICGFGIYQKKRGDKLEVIAENAIADKVRLENELIITTNHSKQEIEKLRRWRIEEIQSNKKAHYQTKNINPTIAADPIKTTAYVNCMIEKICGKDIDCSILVTKK